MVWDVVGITMFAVVGAGFVLVTLFIGRFVRPTLPDPVKGDIYECGELTVGPGWVQFDLRFYVVALLFVIFDVEVALLYPWARVLAENAAAAFWDLLFFVGLLLVGYAFLWKYGYLDWVRSRAAGPLREEGATGNGTDAETGNGIDAATEGRSDAETGSPV